MIHLSREVKQINIKKLPQFRSEASKSGSLLYFTGKPCKHGHLDARYTSTSQCVACNKMHYRKNTKYNPRPSKEEYLKKARRLAIKQKGECLTTTYLNARSYLLFQCSNPNHKPFKITYDNLNHGKWCRKCKDKNQRGKFKYNINDMRRFAEKQSGKCLSKKFLGVKEKLEWSCAISDHPPFPATPDHVINSGQWCPICGEKKKGRGKRPVADVYEIVKNRGGKIICFIDEYSGIKTRIKVECSNGHIWPVTVSSLLHAYSWCPDCNQSTGERITRKIFEATYGVPFPKTRPDFLKIKKGSRLELDGYNEGLELAFEYQGPYHELPVQTERDKIKRQLCLEHGVKIIEISYVKTPWPPEKVLKNVRAAIREVDPNRKVILPDEDFYIQEINDLHELAKSRGGTLESRTYMGGRNDLMWSCSNPNHPSWPATPGNVTRGSWCPYCAGNAPLSIKDLQSFGKTVGLTLVSKEFESANAVYHWKCKEGHSIKRSKSNIIQSIRKSLDACTICAGTHKTVTIKEIVQIAKNRKGECLSTKYIDAHIDLHWRCAYGHEFTRNWNKVQQGYWCKQNGCLDNRRFKNVLIGLIKL